MRRGASNIEPIRYPLTLRNINGRKTIVSGCYEIPPTSLCFLSTILRLTRPPVASLFDGNWINRGIDIGGEYPAAPDGGSAVLWLVPENSYRRVVDIMLRETSCTDWTLYTSHIAWRVGW